MSDNRPDEPGDDVSYEPWRQGTPSATGETPMRAELVSPPETISASPADVQLATAGPRLRRRRVRLPIILFLLTAFSTWLAGTMGFMPWNFYGESLGLGSLRPVRQMIIAHWDSGLVYMACVMSILLAHEMGHFVFTLIYRVPASLPFFLPLPTITGTAGAVIAMDGRVANRPQIFDIGIAGPLAGLALIVPVVWIGIFLYLLRLTRRTRRVEDEVEALRRQAR